MSQAQPLPDVLRVEVKQEHIFHGRRGNCARCPIALALQEQFAVIRDRVAVMNQWLGVYCPSQVGFRYRLPPGATAFIEDFDDGVPVHPFTFEAHRTTESSNAYTTNTANPSNAGDNANVATEL